ncbi:5'-nucleotidase domain-containing protein 1 [Stomoxys calcitrans]|uniref:5'-nucleotidase domain-containing protein 1 n=1 Tax=Stomoxys calcitrans TaxID=35570 RepID=UPI0027E38145|nr:5'-nucleotidase domain-containing protein 1 [Stomoxys calcitrans]
MFNLGVRCVQSTKIQVDTVLFTLVKLRNYISFKTAARCLSVNTNIQRRFYSNNTMLNLKDFCISDYDVIGFDLDGTLLRYNLNNMVPLEYELLVKYLMEKKYPRVLLDKQFDSDFIQKGLIVDAERGNLIKLAADGEILKATHGTRFLSSAEIEDVYGKSRKWDIAQDYINDPLSAWNGPVSEKLRTLLDYFDIAASLVFAQAVDALDETVYTNTNVLQKNDYKVWPDILSGLIQMYSRDHFASGTSAYFEALKQNPEKYLFKTDQQVIQLLRELRSSGKALYLLTGSNIDFANFTASYALGPNWRDLFNCVVSFAKKPGFFFMQRSFLQNNNLSEVPNSEMPLQDDLLAKGKSFSQGNWEQLNESLCKHVLCKDVNKTSRSLYVGDNLIQDVYAPYTKASMDAIAISEEMFENKSSYEYYKIIQSSSWGSYFNLNGRPTLWFSVIENYSKLCISQMDVIANVPVKEKIQCGNQHGFFPNVPNGQLVQ